MSRFNEYMEMARRSLSDIGKNLEAGEGDVEGAVFDFIKKAKRSKYSHDEIIQGLIDTFGMSKESAQNLCKKSVLDIDERFEQDLHNLDRSELLDMIDMYIPKLEKGWKEDLKDMDDDELIDLLIQRVSARQKRKLVNEE